jgi:hypothetical protein
MFICEVSGRVSEPGEKAFKIVTQTRTRDYFEYRQKDEKSPKLLVKVGEGFEIVREKLVCRGVYESYKGIKHG